MPLTDIKVRPTKPRQKAYKLTDEKGLFLLIACVFFIVYTNTATAALASKPKITSLVNQTITSWMKKNNVPGVAVEVYDSGKSYSYAFGYANRENKIPVTQNTIFEIGSFTKLFTSLLVAEEISKNSMQLDDPITKYLPELASNSNFHSVTLKKLGTYTGGLPFRIPSEIQTNADLHHFFTTWNPLAPVGNSWTYSNVSIGLLANAVERRTGKDISELYRTQIFKPLHMESIGLVVPTRLQPNYAQGYDENGHPVPPITMKLFPAAGAMKAAGKDMLQFLKAAANAPNTPEKISKAMQIEQTAYVSTPEALQGLAWVIYPLAEHSKTELLNPPEEMELGPVPAKQLNKPIYIANALIDKTGATDGFRSYIAVIPSQSLGVVILANRFVSNGEIAKVGREILLNIKA